MSMSVQSAPATAARVAEVREGPGPERVPDGDGDDAAVAKVAAPPPGLGARVDKTA